jgi:hypothetical protein
MTVIHRVIELPLCAYRRPNQYVTVHLDLVLDTGYSAG